jgi:uncharacterized protein YbjT (DUF2867 family)
MTKVLVAGATGLVGSSLVKAFRERGKEVRALVRPGSFRDKAKIDPLRASGATLYEGSLEDFDSLVKACHGVEVVISAVGGAQIAQQGELIKAAKEASIARFIPSDFGIDPKVAGKGACLLFDQKALIHQAVKESGLNYTFVHANGLFEYWVHSLGQVGLAAPSQEVQFYGDGTVKAALVRVSDVAKVTALTVDDPLTRNKEITFTANVFSQGELIRLWEDITGQVVQRITVSLEALEEVIAASTTPDTFMNLIIAQLVRSVWFRGDAIKRCEGVLEATTLYPDIVFTSVREALTQLAKGMG